MIIHELKNKPEQKLAEELSHFEAQFLYPLGSSNRFRIDHGDDYTGFFRAMGDGRGFVAEQSGVVCGTIGVSLRTFHSPGKTPEPVAYIGDLKIAAKFRGGLVGGKLLLAAQEWCQKKCTKAYSVVMGGTSISPVYYTGRAGVPAFKLIGDILIARISTTESDDINLTTWRGEPQRLKSCFLKLSAQHSFFTGGTPESRSLLDPVWLSEPNDQACGLLEDTRKVKRLTLHRGEELISSHLSQFSYANDQAGTDLIKAALAVCKKKSIPGLFVTLNDKEQLRLLASLRNSVELAPASIYGTGFAQTQNWRINSSEV